jgi:3-oxoacyl-[acyl-carrier protein] reductase
MIIVTGASRGLGRAICGRLRGQGIDVAGLARQPDPEDRNTFACDVTNRAALKALASQWKREGRAVEGLINAAGIAAMNLALTTPESSTRRIIETNLLGTIFCCQLFAPLMLKSGRGAIINFSSIAVALGLKGESVYAASKAGVEGFTRSFAREMADFGVTVNCLAPGPVQTDLLRGVSEAQINKIIEQQIMPRPFSPDDVCDLVELLLDSKARHLTGQVIHVGGA